MLTPGCGRIWPAEDSVGVGHWPASATVCQCTGVTRGELSAAIAEGATEPAQLAKITGASTVCGSCTPLVANLLGHAATEPAPLGRTLLIAGLLAFIAALAILLLPALPYADSVQVAWRWDELWRDSLSKQISGFTILGVALVSLLISLRKRIPRLHRLGGYPFWRATHTLLGLLALGAILVHTGFRLGNGLNFLLMLSFASMVVLGAASSALVSLEHRLAIGLGAKLRRQSIWLHILLFWPLPALLGWHVFKTYWF